MGLQEPWLLENGNSKGLGKEMSHGRTAHSRSSSSLRKKSDQTLVSQIRWEMLRHLLANFQPWIFALSLPGLTPLAERVSFLTEQIAFYTGPTVGGLLNATCGNATELIIAILALCQGKVEVVKNSLLGSILSNLLLVLGTSLLCGGIANINREQKYERGQADVNILLLLLGLLCHILPLLFCIAGPFTRHKSPKAPVV